MLLESKVLRWQTMGIGNRKKRSGRQIPRTIYRRHRRKENTGGTNTVSSQRWGFWRGQSPALLGSRRSADESAWHVSGRQGRPTTIARDIFAFGFQIDGKGGALFEWQGWLLVWCGLCSASARSRPGRGSFQGLEKDRLSRGLRAFRSAGEPSKLFPGGARNWP